MFCNWLLIPSKAQMMNRPIPDAEMYRMIKNPDMLKDFHVLRLPSCDRNLMRELNAYCAKDTSGRWFRKMIKGTRVHTGNPWSYQSSEIIPFWFFERVNDAILLRLAHSGLEYSSYDVLFDNYHPDLKVSS